MKRVIDYCPEERVDIFAGCGHEYDVLYTSQSKVAEEEPKEECPVCGNLEKERLINTGTSFVLKGPGWAKDGY